MPQWTSKGGNVTLVDLQEQQLQEGLKYVHQLRAAETGHSGTWGEVKTAHPDSLGTILKDAWLVVEVSLCELGISNIISQKAVRSRKPEAEAKGDHPA